MELKAGYKQTAAGLIPEDWEVSTYGEVFTELRGGAPFKPSDFTRMGVKVLPKGGVARGGTLQIDESDIQYCTENYAANHKTNTVDKSHTIVVLRDLVPSGPSIGLMVKIEADESFILAQGVYGFKTNPVKACPDYLIQLSNGTPYRRLMNSIMVGSTQVHVTNTALKLAPFPCPPVSEQRAIAAALSDVDALISGLDQLIAKKRDLKQAAMQQLLTGKQRLPGFQVKPGYKQTEIGMISDDWNVKTLYSVCDVRDGTHESPKFYHQGVPFVTSRNIVDGRIDLSGINYIGQDDAIEFNKRSKVDCGDILMSMIGTVGNALLIESEPNFCIKNVALIKPKSINARYLIQLINSPIFQTALIEKLNGGIQKFIALGSLRSLFISIPPINEQAAIAAILSDMDTELSALEQRRDKTRALKQGMMQQLLTGRIRLVQPEIPAAKAA